MEKTTQAIIVIGITLLLVVIFNIGLILSYKQRVRDAQRMKDLGKVISAAKHPFKFQDKDLDELSRLIDAAKHTEDQNDHPDEK